MNSIILSGITAILSGGMLLYIAIQGPNAINNIPTGPERPLLLRKKFFQQISIALGSFIAFTASSAYLIPHLVDLANP
jgi:hypothetical protein